MIRLAGSLMARTVKGVACEVVQARPLREAHQLIAVLVARHRFVVPSAWFESD